MADFTVQDSTQYTVSVGGGGPTPTPTPTPTPPAGVPWLLVAAAIAAVAAIGGAAAYVESNKRR